MKQFLSTITLLGALAGAASAAPYVLPSPQPGALTPYDMQPAYGIEGLYSIAQKGDHPDTYGVRGSFNLYDSGEGQFRHQFSANIAALWGSDDAPVANIMPSASQYLPEGQKMDMDLFIMPVTLGYNLNVGLTDSIFLYVGAKAGYAWSSCDISTTVSTGAGDVTISDDKSAGGFTYSVGAGLKVQCSDAVYIHVGYEFGRSYLDYNLEDKDVIYGAHTISAGISASF